MDIFSLEFFTALGAIILIDLVLAGDNALVIALAARKLPPALQKKAILWGTFGAIFVRALITVGVVWLLKIPGLLLVGGLLLVWIAIKLLDPTGQGEEHAGGSGATSFIGAMKTIVIADAVMGVDNVLGVAGAAEGSFLLVILGLLISIPIVVWCSGLVLRLVGRFPIIIYAGAAVLALTAAKMILSEPLIKDWTAQFEVWSWVFIAAVIALVVGIGYLRAQQHKASQKKSDESGLDQAATAPREVSRAHSVAAESPAARSAVPLSSGETAMRNILIPINDTQESQAAVKRFVDQLSGAQNLFVHLVHVVPRFNRHIGRFISRAARERMLKDRLDAAVKPAIRVLEAAGVRFDVHESVASDVPEEIIALAKSLRCELIVVGSRRKTNLLRAMSNSVTGRLLAEAPMPVEVVLSGQASVFERIGLPAGVGVAIVAMIAD